MTQDEEFEFRLRLERERGQAQAQPREPSAFGATPGGAATYGQMQGRRMLGQDKKGDTMGDIHRRVKEGIYEFGGRVTDLTGSPFLGSMANAGAEALSDPLTYAGGMAGMAVKPVAEAAGKSLMWSALKPNKFARESGDAAKAVETLLQKGYNVTEGGVEKMTGAIDTLDDALSAAIKGSTANVPATAVLGRMKGAIDKFKDGIDQAENLGTIRNELLKFLDHPQVAGALDIPVETAQRIKRGIYQELGDKAYGFGIKPAAQMEGKKAIAGGLKDGIESAVPEVGPLNAQMGSLINARDLARDRALVAANRNPLGLGALVDPSKWPTVILDRSELAKSLAARGLYSGVAPTTGVLGSGVGAIPGIFSERP